MTDNYSPPIASAKVEHERKTFFIDLRENDRGKFIKFVEQVGTRRDTILIPKECVQEIIAGFERVLREGGGR